MFVRPDFFIAGISFDIAGAFLIALSIFRRSPEAIAAAFHLGGYRMDALSTGDLAQAEDAARETALTRVGVAELVGGFVALGIGYFLQKRGSSASLHGWREFVGALIIAAGVALISIGSVVFYKRRYQGQLEALVAERAPKSAPTANSAEIEGKPVDDAVLLLIFEQQEDELERQTSQIESLTRRAEQFLGLAVLLLGIVVSARPPSRGALSSILFGLALVIFLGVVYEGWQAWRIRSWRVDPSARGLWEHFRDKSEEYLRHQIILNRLEGVDVNERRNQDKLRHLRWAGVWLLIEVLYLVGLVIAKPYL